MKVDVKENALLSATLSGDDFWRDADGVALPVSASDLERHEYCPLSWSLSREGNSGQGESLVAGIKRHAEIHNKMKDFQSTQSQMRRSVTIWTWWFSVIIALSVDALAFNYIDDVVTPLHMAQCYYSLRRACSDFSSMALKDRFDRNDSSAKNKTFTSHC